MLKHVVEHLLRSDGTARDVSQGIQAGAEMLTEQVAAQSIFHPLYDKGNGFMGTDEGFIMPNAGDDDIVFRYLGDVGGLIEHIFQLLQAFTLLGAKRQITFRAHLAAEIYLVAHHEQTLPLATLAHVPQLLVCGTFICHPHHNRGLMSLRHMIGKGRVVEEDGHTRVVVVKDKISSFSWMNYIVMSEDDYADHPEYILRHERAHVAARHSWDILACDLLIVFQWFNPAAWLLKSELQAAHEYEADHRVLASGVNAVDYQLFLIRKSAGEKLFSAANNLNQYSLKNRITMMKKTKSNKWGRCKILAALPVAATAMVAFATPKAESLTREITRESDALVSAVKQVASDSLKLKGKPVGILVIKDNDETYRAVEESPEEGKAEVITEKTPDGKDIYDAVDVMPQFPGGVEAMVSFINENIKYPMEAAEQHMQGRVIVQFTVNEDGQISDATVLRSVDPALDAEALRVVNSTPKWTPGKQDGKTVKVHYVLPIKFNIAEEKTSEGNVYYIVDGKHVTDISHIKPADIESIQVYKGKEATDRYGEAAKDGAIVVTMKKK